MKRALLAGGILLLSGCSSITGCTYEERSVKASGSLTNGGNELAYAEITVSAVKGSLQWKTLNHVIRGESIKGHVTSIMLVGVRNGTAVAVTIPLAPSTSYVSTGGLIQRDGDSAPDLGGVYELLAANGASVDIATDLPSLSHITVPLTKTNQTDWFRPHNCY